MRGMNDPFKLKEIKNFLHLNKVTVCALLETRVRPHNQGKIQKKFGDRWNWICNYSSTNKGSILIGWVKNEDRVRLLLASEQFIIVEVQNTQGECVFHYVVVYGLHIIEDRKSLWVDLGIYVTGIQIRCILMGDYNDVYQAVDKLQGNDITHAETVDFSNFLVDNCLSEAPSSGNFYSWSNKGHGADRISSRIDKAIVNVYWVGVGLSGFLTIWFLDMVKQAWGYIQCNGQMKNLWVKLHKTKEAIKLFHANSYSQAHRKVDNYKRQLERLQNNPDLNHDAALQKSERETLELSRKGSLIVVKVRNAKSKIALLHNSQGEVLTDPRRIGEEIKSFYMKLLGSNTETIEAIDMAMVRKGHMLSQQACNILIQPVTNQEIDATLAAIDDSKAPGLDGFNAVFFKQTWAAIKSEVYSGVLEFFDYNLMYKPVNITAITLIPKVENPTHTNDLLMFARADQGSVVEMSRAFQRFSRASGLEANNDKSCIYFAGINQETANQLAILINMPIGDLPFRYLGVPLAAKKLNFTQCKPLIDRITDRAHG
ncbi:uncharacterized protein LOC104907527 [Beta vulgaris subsp. vulgaris]|uniref:uncharacterized protein LOC104907527 n=1 Tax=Beta vulgaris subsp. vulgaris TaxID=3555 RepID=UPI0020374723|nr:uncharacterized protein LOC104907527 [Beta vulgaris subsp. vulgaris]